MDWFDKFVIGFRTMYESKPFAQVSELLEHHQIETFAQYEEVYELFIQIQVAVPGSFPSYHFKMALDHLVEANIILRKSVNRWPVSPHAGTGKKLMSLYRLSTAQIDKLSRMLGELLHRLQARGATSPLDFHGTIGASLCWNGRLSARNRYEQTTSSSDKELLDLFECNRLSALVL